MFTGCFFLNLFFGPPVFEDFFDISCPGVTVLCGGFPRLADLFEISCPDITLSCRSLRRLLDIFEVLKAQIFALFSSPGVTVVCGGFARLAGVFEIGGPEIAISCGSLRRLPDMFAVSKDPFFAGFPCGKGHIIVWQFSTVGFPRSVDFASGFGTLALT